MMTRFSSLALVLLLPAVSARVGNQDEKPQQARLLQTTGTKMQGQYIVRLSDDADRKNVMTQVMNDNPGASVMYEYEHVLNGFAVSGVVGDNIMSVASRFPGVVLEVEEDAEAVATQVTWGLDRIDDRSQLFDGSFESNVDGSGVDIYVLDTGARATHVEFDGRVTDQIDFTPDNDNVDRSGHGTHVAGIAVGRGYGVAPGANLIPVKVLGAAGGGSNAGIIAGLDWVVDQHGNRSGRSVANLSLQGPRSVAMNTAVANTVDAGVVVTAAAGNSNRDACEFSPASEPSAITVGATTADDYRPIFSNWGSCVDIWAPGTDIVSASNANDVATTSLSGTSMSAPYVAGAAALLLQSDSSLSGNSARDRIISMSTQDALLGNLGEGSPNALLYTGAIGTAMVADTPPADLHTANAAGSWTGHVGISMEEGLGLERAWVHCRGQC